MLIIFNQRDQKRKRDKKRKTFKFWK